MTPSRAQIFDVPVDLLEPSEVLKTIGSWLQDSHPHHIVTANSLMLLESRRNEKLKMLLQSASLVVPDSYGLFWGLRHLGYSILDYYPGIELMHDICILCAEKKMRVYLLGGENTIAETSAYQLQNLCPGLLIAGTHPGYFSKENETELINDIRHSQTNVLFVGLGSPKQEFWIQEHFPALSIPVVMGIGGSLDVYAGKLKRAPDWLRKKGLEWAYRLFQEPHRLPRILELPHFACAVIQEKWRRISSHRTSGDVIQYGEGKGGK